MAIKNKPKSKCTYYCKASWKEIWQRKREHPDFTYAPRFSISTSELEGISSFARNVSVATLYANSEILWTGICCCPERAKIIADGEGLMHPQILASFQKNHKKAIACLVISLFDPWINKSETVEPYVKNRIRVLEANK